MARDLATALLDGDRRALARALTVVENEDAGREALLEALAGHGGGAHRVGITGPPGAGKSTLVSALVAAWREADRRVGVLAVDPTSPFRGGALLGDRVRMGRHLGDEGVFIRSLATRGALGGLSAAVEDALDVLDAARYDPLLVETVGVGQAEVDVAGACDTTVVVLAPGSGDEIQAMKAGLIEIADVLVVNQADRPGADRLAQALEAALDLRDGGSRPPVLATTATTGEGVVALREVLDARADGGGEAALAARRLQRARRRIRLAVDRRRIAAFWAGREEALDAAAAAVAEGRETAAAAARRLTEETS